MATTVTETSTIRQPSVRHLTPLGELMDESYAGHIQFGALYERKANGENVDKELESLNRHLDNVEAQIRQHPESAWYRLECIEERRLGR